MSDLPRHLLVIGGGIGGYTAAIRAARAGLRVTLIEQAALGGTCLNVGCIPTKSLLLHARPGGDMATIARTRDAAVRRLVSGVDLLVRRNRITLRTDRARFTGPRRVRLETSGEEIAADLVVIATGSVPALPRLPGIDLPGVITSDTAVAMDTVPERIAILGGGAIGVEFAQIFAGLGSAVTLIEMASTLLPAEDPEAVAVLATTLKAQGVKIHTGTGVTGIERSTAGLSATFPGGSAEADLVLVATGRRPNIADLDLDAAGIAVGNGAVKVDPQQRTNIPGTYAVGDVCGGALLAHRAAADAEVAMAGILGHPAVPTGQRAMPHAVYTMPGLASVGLTEAEARAKGPIRIGRFPFAANGRAVVDGAPEGFVKIVADARYGQILGVTIVGAHAADLLGEATLAVEMEITLAAFVQVIHPHPTLSEALVEAAHDALDGGAVHLQPGAYRAST
ncbi:dihydrolipoyl dehydrogenase [Chachezhania sediminis]|uniref:dihydrolipoyl dehydrogenase n=1 Tax=Chachezhania sediminis TaxID=2599291 RepID=UPI00131D5D23|nr:dihydrolipoyl dehydrogenase [Chachezhania sediminis]